MSEKVWVDVRERIPKIVEIVQMIQMTQMIQMQRLMLQSGEVIVIGLIH